MPRLFGIKAYDSKIDIYTSKTTQDANGVSQTTVNYLEPDTYDCIVQNLRPQTTLEIFSPNYVDSEFLRVEIDSDSLKDFQLSQQAGNIRSKSNEKYFPRFGQESSFIFNIDGISPQIDPWGKIVSVELYLRLGSSTNQTAIGE